MEVTKKTYSWNFLQMMCAMLIMFLLVAILGDNAVNIVLQMNDNEVKKTFVDHVVFWCLAVFSTIVWALIWVWFKKTEKICVDYLVRK